MYHLHRSDNPLGTAVPGRARAAGYPPPPPAGGGPDPAPRPRRGGRFMSGLLVGVAVTGVGFGAATMILDDDRIVVERATPVTTDEPTIDAAESAARDTDRGTPDVPDASPTEAVRPAGTAILPTSVHDLVVGARPSILAIHTTLTQTDVFGRPVQGQSAGTGFVLSDDGYIVTNAHVVRGSERIAVSFDGGEQIDAELVAADPRSDLAVLKVDRTGLQPLPLGDSDALRVGDPVVAIGNALDLGAEPTVTSGIVSAKDRSIPMPGGGTLTNLIQTDTAINPGNSGGPLLDMRGEVVGINTAVSGQGQNIGFAISIVPAQELIDQLRTGAVPRHALLGVTTRPAVDGEGAEVVAVEPGSAADRAGIAVGDVVIAVDDDPVAAPSDLGAAIASRRPDDEIVVTIRREGRELRLDAVLGARRD